MKRSLYLLLISSSILAACGGDGKDGNKAADLAKLKKERTEIDVKIQKLETEANKNTPKKATPVTVIALQQTHFSSYVEVQSEIEGDQDVNASSQAAGTVENILVRVGQRVGRGATLATLDAAAIEQQIKALDPAVALAKTLYEKQQKLWAQNIGSEVQLLSAKAQYESSLKQRAALVAQRSMYTIKSPISGTVDAINVKIGDVAAPGNPLTGIRVVNTDQLKAEASLGENYIGKVKTGDPVLLVFPDLNDSIKTKVSYVAQGVDPISRAFKVQVRLGGNKKLRPNMSAKMKISNYENPSALVVPVSVIQKTADGDMLYIADGNKAKAVFVKTGRTANGNIEILEGLNTGDKVIVEGYEELDNGEAVAIK